MNTLALDTSTDILSIALETETSYEERLIRSPRNHLESLLPEIEELSARASVKLSDLSLLVCTKGPGSFTGLRIGMATLKGLSAATGVPVVSIPTLDAISATVGIYKGPVLSVIDAKKKRYYLSLTENGKEILPASDISLEDALPLLEETEGRILITGPDAAVFAAKLPGTLDFMVDPLAPRNLSRALIALGKQRLEEAGPDDIGEGPMYIRRSDAEEALEKKRKEYNEKL